MELNELLMKRRSVRKYEKTQISEKEVEELISSTLYAASWKNSETGRYYVAISDEAISAVYDALPDFNQKSSEGAAYIVAAFKKGISGTSGKGEFTDEHTDMWGAYDLGLQNSYLMLKATEMGYDTLIMGLRDEDALRRYFEIPEDEIIMPVIAIGKRAAEPKLNPRKDTEEVLKIK